MIDIESAITKLGHIAATHELLALGFGQSGLRAAVRAGRILRIRKGWYCLPTLDDEVQRAARVGGRMTCESLAGKLGLWVPHRDGRLHVAVLPDRTQLRTSDRYWVRRAGEGDESVVVHWTGTRDGVRTRVTVGDMLVHLAGCHDPLFVFIVAESALAHGRLSMTEFTSVLRRVSARHAELLRFATSLSASGGESGLAVILRALGIPFRQQVWIGRDRVDFLIGDRLVVEVDGRSFHVMARDNRRDGRLIRAGYSTVHVDSDLVLFEPEVVRAIVLEKIARNEHRV